MCRNLRPALRIAASAGSATSPAGYKPPPSQHSPSKVWGCWGLGYQPGLGNATGQTAVESLKIPSSSCLWTGRTLLVAKVINFSSLSGSSSLKSCGWQRVTVQGAPSCGTCTSLGPPHTCTLLVIHTIHRIAGRRQAPRCKLNLHPLQLNIFPKYPPWFCSPGNTSSVIRQSWRRSPTGNTSSF